MRQHLMLATLAAILACGPASIGSYPEGDNSARSRSSDPDAGGTTEPTPDATSSFALNVALKGSGSGAVTANPGSLTCDTTSCKGTFPKGTTVTVVPAAMAGSMFGAWTGACTGTTACAPVMNADVDVEAEFQTIDGTWLGTYTNTRDARGCTFNNAGNLSAVLTTDAGAVATTANVTGLELRFIPSCQISGSTTGTAPSSAVVVSPPTTALTGTWTFDVKGASGTLAFPFTATLADKTLTGTWTCPTCKGSFTLTKQ